MTKALDQLSPVQKGIYDLLDCYRSRLTIYYTMPKPSYP
jgi:hypothetical protein